MIKALVLCFALLASSAWSGEMVVGHVKTVSGDATVRTEGNVVKAAPGTAIYEGSVLETGPRSSMGVTFKDETIMSFGADTRLSVDEYLYAPSQGKLKLSSKITKGSLNYISGVIAKLQPTAVSIGTPTARA